MHQKPMKRPLHTRWITICMLLFALCSSAVVVSPAEARKVRKILVLHSYHQGLQWTDSISDGIQSELRSAGDDIEIHFEYLDTKRNPGEDYFRHLVQFESYKTQMASIDFEVVISSDNNALRFMVENGDHLFPGVPVVFCGVNNFQPGMLKGMANITGVVEAIDYAGTLDLMHRLHPDRDRVMVILDKTATGQAIKKEFDGVTAGMSGAFKFEYYQDFVLSEIEGKISGLGKRDLIYILTFNRDRMGNFISYVDGLRMIRNVSRVPIYGSWDFYFGNGIVGGMITSGFSQGQQAARLARQILDGTPANRIPIIDQSPNRYMFDHRELSRFGLSPASLPEGSQLIHPPVGWFQRHAGIIIALLAIFAGMALVFAWRLSVKHRLARRLEQINLELDRRVAEQTHALQSQNTLLETEIRERRRTEEELIDKTHRLEHALSKVKTLSGMLPICANCKKIRDDQGYWNQIEAYIDEHTDATFTHGICPGCTRDLYPDIFDDELAS